MFSGCFRFSGKREVYECTMVKLERGDLERHLTVAHRGYEFGEPDLGMLNRLNFKIILIEASK